MTDIPAHCVEEHKRQRFTLSERGVTLKFTNRNRHKIRRIDVDGCVVGSDEETKKCDYVVEDLGGEQFIYVELKSSHFGIAIAQLESSSVDARTKPPAGKRVEWIVCMGRAIPNGTTIQTEKERRRKADVKLFVYKSGRTHTIGE